MNAQRGQTLPFWAIGTMLSLALLFFLANYVSAVSWQIRAQNAADSAASAALSVEANIFNEESVLLYAAAVDEYRVRAINQAILNTINGVGGCDPTPGGSCDQDYQSLLNEYNVALNGYTNDVQLIGQADQLSQGGQQQDARKAVSAFGQNCGQTGGGVDCTFAYTVLDASSIAAKGAKNQMAPMEVDLVACHNVSYFVPQLFKLGATASYGAVARSAGAVVPAVQESFRPGITTNPATGQLYQPIETQWASAYSSQAYSVDFAGLTVNLNWYTNGSIRPYSGTITSGSYQCL